MPDYFRDLFMLCGLKSYPRLRKVLKFNRQRQAHFQSFWLHKVSSTKDHSFQFVGSVFVFRRKGRSGFDTQLMLARIIVRCWQFPYPWMFCLTLITVIKGFSFPMNGIIMGGMDWSAAMFSMCASNVACFLTMRFIREESAKVLWLAWVASYAAQGVVLFIRYKSRTGSAWSHLSKPPSKGKSEWTNYTLQSVDAWRIVAIVK